MTQCSSLLFFVRLVNSGAFPFCSDYLLASFTVWFDISALTVGYFRSLHFVSVSYRDLSSSVLRIRAIEFCFFEFAGQVICILV